MLAARFVRVIRFASLSLVSQIMNESPAAIAVSPLNSVSANSSTPFPPVSTPSPLLPVTRCAVWSSTVTPRVRSVALLSSPTPNTSDPCNVLIVVNPNRSTLTSGVAVVGSSTRMPSPASMPVTVPAAPPVADMTPPDTVSVVPSTMAKQRSCAWRSGGSSSLAVDRNGEAVGRADRARGEQFG